MEQILRGYLIFENRQNPLGLPEAVGVPANNGFYVDPIRVSADLGLQHIEMEYTGNAILTLNRQGNSNLLKYVLEADGGLLQGTCAERISRSRRH